MKRDFKGIWIPKEIWLNENLTVMEKLFLVEIDSLDNEKGCFASNAHFSKFFKISKNRSTEIIKSLEEKGFISIEIQRNGRQIVKRILRVLGIRKTEYPYSENRDTPIRKTEYPYSENREGNNTYNNNTIEREMRAHEFLKKHYTSRWEIFEMQNKSSIPDWDKFLLHFSDTVDIEGLEFTDKILFARASKYARNWAENKNREKQRSQEKVFSLPQMRRID